MWPPVVVVGRVLRQDGPQVLCWPFTLSEAKFWRSTAQIALDGVNGQHRAARDSPVEGHYSESGCSLVSEWSYTPCTATVATGLHLMAHIDTLRGFCSVKT